MASIRKIKKSLNRHLPRKVQVSEGRITEEFLLRFFDETKTETPLFPNVTVVRGPVTDKSPYKHIHDFKAKTYSYIRLGLRTHEQKEKDELYRESFFKLDITINIIKALRHLGLPVGSTDCGVLLPSYSIPEEYKDIRFTTHFSSDVPETGLWYNGIDFFIDDNRIAVAIY